MTSKYISNGQERIEIVDRKAIGSVHRRSTRWIVWNVTTQTVVSEHATRKAAQEAFDGVD